MPLYQISKVYLIKIGDLCEDDCKYTMKIYIEILYKIFYQKNLRGSFYFHIFCNETTTTKAKHEKYINQIQQSLENYAEKGIIDIHKHFKELIKICFKACRTFGTNCYTDHKQASKLYDIILF